MAGRFIRVKKAVIPMITLAIITSQLTGCKIGSKELLDMIDKGDSVVIEVVEPSYEINVNGEKEEKADYGTLSESDNSSSDDMGEVLGVDDRGYQYGENWTEVNPIEVPSDPNKVLNEGWTLGKAALEIEQRTKFLRDWGSTEEEIKADIQIDLDYWGTTMEEIERLPKDYKYEKPVVAEKPTPSESKVSTRGSKGTTSNTVGGTSSSNSAPLVFKTDKWYTKEQKEAARDKAKASGWLEGFEEEARNWENAIDEVKGYGSPYDEIRDGTKYYNSIEEMPEHQRSKAVYEEGKGWSFDPFVR